MKRTYIAAYHQSKFGKLMGMPVPEILRRYVKHWRGHMRLSLYSIEILGTKNLSSLKLPHKSASHSKQEELGRAAILSVKRRASLLLVNTGSERAFGRTQVIDPRNCAGPLKRRCAARIRRSCTGQFQATWLKWFQERPQVNQCRRVNL